MGHAVDAGTECFRHHLRRKNQPNANRGSTVNGHSRLIWDAGLSLHLVPEVDHSKPDAVRCLGFVDGDGRCFTLEHRGLRHTFTVDTDAVATVTFWTAMARPPIAFPERWQGHPRSSVPLTIEPVSREKHMTSTTTTSPPAMTPRRAATAALLGSALEYYDFLSTAPQRPSSSTCCSFHRGTPPLP